MNMNSILGKQVNNYTHALLYSPPSSPPKKKQFLRASRVLVSHLIGFTRICVCMI